MNMRIHITLKGALYAMSVVMVCLILPAGASAQQMPQDHWYFDRFWGEAGAGPGQLGYPICGMAVGSDGLIYISDTANDRIQVFQQDGTFVRTWGSLGASAGQLYNPTGIAIGPDGNVYVVDNGNKRVQVFQPDGTFVRMWGSSGSGEGQFGFFTGSAINGIAVSTNGLVFVVDIQSNCRIQVFQPDGTFVRMWGSSGTAPGEFTSYYRNGLAVNSEGLVYVYEGNPGRIQAFREDGTYVRQWGPSSSSGVIATGVDDQVFTAGKVFSSDGVLVANLAAASVGSMAVAEDGSYFVTTFNPNGIKCYKRATRNPGAMPRNDLPLPHVVSVEQRGGVPYVDVDYIVHDPDSSNVTVTALAFVNGSNTLEQVLKMNTLIEGTAANLGEGIAANTPHRLTWNAAADWSTNFGNVQIEILAKDERGLLGFHFLNIPSNGPDPELKIDRYPVTQNDLLSCWYWLIATNDAAINLASGTVYGVGGIYDGKILAQTANTTADGRLFLWERMGVREATSQEISRAKVAYTPGVTNSWLPRNSGDPRIAVNEFGFSTYASWGTNAWYVVKP